MVLLMMPCWLTETTNPFDAIHPFKPVVLLAT